MHPSPIRSWIRLADVATISFGIVLVSGHFVSNFWEYSPRRAAWLQRAR
jgi:hypothetical protein